MGAFTEPVRTGIGAVCVEYGRPKWPITMLNHTNIPGTENCFFILFLAPYARTTRYEEVFLPEGQKRPRSLRSPGLVSVGLDTCIFVMPSTNVKGTRVVQSRFRLELLFELRLFVVVHNT